MLATKFVFKTFLGLLVFHLAFAQAGDGKLESKNKATPQVVIDPNGTSGAAPEATGGVLGFLEWKSARVHEAQQKVEQMNKGQTQIFQEGKSVQEEKTAMDEQKLNFNVDVALQLNVQDYFSMYLKNLTQEDFREATKKMNSEEVAELLLAYKNSQEKEKAPPLKFSKIPKNNAKSKKSDI